MERQSEFYGEEENARRQRREHHILSVGVGGAATLVTMLFRVLFGTAAGKIFNRLSAELGNERAWIIAGLVGVSTFCIVKMYLFFKSCRRDAILGILCCLKVTIKHYARISIQHPYFLLLIVCNSSVIAILLKILSKQNANPFPVCTFIITAAPMNLIALFLYKGILGFARISQSDLGQVLLKEIHPGIKWETTWAVNPNRQITEKLLALKNVDLVCIAAVHFSHLMRYPENLKKIKSNNPSAGIYFMPAFPYSWHVLERAAELEYPFRKAYLGPLVRGIHNACKYLEANVRLRHNPAEFRLTLWAKLAENSNNHQRPEKLRETCKHPTDIKYGGFFAQQYVHAKEGYESPYLNVDNGEWCGALLYLINWFFENWEDNCSPIQPTELAKEEKSLLRVSKDIGISRHKRNRLRDSGDLATYLQKEECLKELYLGIENGNL